LMIIEKSVKICVIRGFFKKEYFLFACKHFSDDSNYLSIPK
jgi:hypothetical protein